MINHYESMKSKLIFETRPKFNLDVPDVINEKSKELSAQVLQKVRERSNTSFSYSNYKALSNDKKNSFSSAYNYNSSPFNEDFKPSRDSGMKIPMNNPLAALGKIGNKFDDSGLGVNQVNLSFNSMTLGNAQK
jgi:hypothetical protein